MHLDADFYAQKQEQTMVAELMQEMHEKRKAEIKRRAALPRPHPATLNLSPSGHTLASLQASDQRRTPRYKQNAPAPITTQFSNYEPFDFLAAAKKADDAAREAARMAMLHAEKISVDHTTTVAPLIAPHAPDKEDGKFVTHVIHVPRSQLYATPNMDCAATMTRTGAPVIATAATYTLTSTEAPPSKKPLNFLLEFLQESRK
jgi:hypothetical protein